MSSEPGARIALCEPELTPAAWSHIKSALDSGWISSAGAYVDRFESRLAARVGCEHGVAMVNGTAALHVALRTAGVQPGDEVLLPALTFIASGNAVSYCGATPVFLDSDPVYNQLDPDAVRAYLETECVDGDSGRVNAETGARVAAIMPVHLLGHPCDIDPLLEIASKYGIPVVEDATEALGARYKGRAVGSFGASACFSFNGNKLISCGGGGMLTTNEADTARYARYLSTTAKDNAEEYVHGEVGYNYRLTNIQAALGVSQLESLDAFIAAKLETANAYAEGLGEVPGVEVMPEAPWAESVFWLYTVRINPTAFGMSAPELRQRLKADNIDTRPLWQPLHVSPAYRHLKPRRNPVAEDIHARAVSLPSSVGLTPDQRARVIDRVREACALAV